MATKPAPSTTRLLPKHTRKEESITESMTSDVAEELDAEQSISEEVHDVDNDVVEESEMSEATSSIPTEPILKPAAPIKATARQPQFSSKEHPKRLVHAPQTPSTVDSTISSPLTPTDDASTPQAVKVIREIALTGKYTKALEAKEERVHKQ